MSTKNKKRPARAKTVQPPANVVWFDIPADDPMKLKKFYGSLFGWKIKKFSGLKDYWHIGTGGPDKSPDGGLLKRTSPGHQGFTNYINVASVDKAAAKLVKLGGSICVPKTPVGDMGSFIICQDPEKNAFALWEMNSKKR